MGRPVSASAIALTLSLTVLAMAPPFRAHPATAPSTGRMHPASLRATVTPATIGPDRIFACQKPGPGDHCYGPRQIRTAYGIQRLLDAGKNGSGKTIAIIDSFQDPTIKDDLRDFDSAFGLAPPPSFQIVAPFGLTPFDPNNANQVGWSAEIAIDVEWAHAIAPRANIVLALAPSDSDADQIRMESYIVNNRLGDVLSMSFGEGESCMPPSLRQQEHELFEAATARGVTFVAGAGDQGAAQFCTDPNALFKAVSIPASDPFVTAVGGTNLIADLKTGAYRSESVWNDSSGAGGGGFSSIFSRPSFQNGTVPGPKRGVPDVSYDASLNGIIIAWGSSGTATEFWVFGGTSIGAPQWAGIFAIADQVRGQDLGNVNPALYAIGNSDEAISDFHDVTVGDNSFGGISGYSAGPGWDAASGWGSPKASNLVDSLVDR